MNQFKVTFSVPQALSLLEVGFRAKDLTGVEKTALHRLFGQTMTACVRSENWRRVWQDFVERHAAAIKRAS